MARRRIYHVVRREAAIEMHVTEHPDVSQAVEGSVDRRSMHAGIARRHLIEDFLG